MQLIAFFAGYHRIQFNQSFYQCVLFEVVMFCLVRLLNIFVFDLQFTEKILNKLLNFTLIFPYNIF